VTPLEIIRRAQGSRVVDEDGRSVTLELLPPLSAEEFAHLEAMIPCRLPAEVRELLSFSRGFANGPWEGADFSGLTHEESFGMEEVFPCSVPIAADGCGNFWVVDVTSRSAGWGPIFYACHDPPVIVFQTDDLSGFMEEFLQSGNTPQPGGLHEVHEKHAFRIWSENPGVLNHEGAIQSSDRELKSFAETLDGSFQFIDLRNAKTGDGFSWGRYGPRTIVRRHGETPLFACQKGPEKKSLLSRLFGR